MMSINLKQGAAFLPLPVLRRRENMKTNKKINIMIHPVENRKGNYVAYFKSEFLNATFSVFFQDTITGALALHTFSEMIRKKYEQKEIDFILSEAQVPFRSEALLDVVNRQPSFFYGKLVSSQV